MTQLELLSRAKQGDPEAIATLLNRFLQPQGITAAANRTATELQIMLQADQVPDQTRLVPLVRDRLRSLGLAGIGTVHLYGRSAVSPIPVWHQTLSLQASSSSQPTRKPSSRRSQPPCPRPFLIPAILATVLAFPPTGVFALIFAVQVESRHRREDYQGAKAASSLARNLSWVSFGIAGAFYTAIAIMVGGAFFLQANRAGGPRDELRQSSEVRTFLSAINRAQTAYYRENRLFASSLVSLGLGIQSNRGYTYRIASRTDDQVVVHAIPYRPGLSPYQGVVFVDREGGDSALIYGICRSQISVETPDLPQLVGGRIDCGADAVLEGEETQGLAP